MNEIYASGGKIQEGFWDAVQMPNSVRSAYGSDLKKLATHMNGVADAGGTATATLKDMNNVLLEQGRAVVDDTTLTQKFVGGIKSVGMTLGSMAFSSIANLGISWVLQTVIGGISDWVRRDDIAIENGQKSQQSISDTFNEFSKGKTTLNTLGQSFASANQQITNTGDAIQSVATKYTELSKGVDKNTNANIGLSDKDYQTYLDISSQLATLYPQLQSGTDAQGNAMLNLGTNAQNAAKSIQELYSSSMLSTNVKIGDELQQAFKGVSTQVDKYQKQVDEYDKKAAEYRDKQTDASDFKLNATKLDKFVKDRGITLDTKELGDEYSNYVNRITDILKENNIAYDINDNGGAFIDKDGNTRTISNLWITDPNVTEEQLQNVGKKIASFSNDIADKFSVKASEMESKSASTTALIQDQWKGMTDSLGQYLQTTDSFDKLDSNLKTNLLKNLKNLDIESLSKEYDGDALQFMYDKFITPLSNLSKDQQQAISDVLNIDETKSTAKEYADQVNSAFEKIFPNDKKLQDQWKKNFGLQDIIDDNNDQIEKLSNKFDEAKSKITKSDLETLTNGDRDIAYNLVVDDGEAFNTFDELQKRIAATKQTISEKDLSLDSMKQVVTDATSAYSSLSTAVSESTSDTGMTADSISNIKSSIESLINDNDELKDFDLNSLFTDTAKGVKLNNDKLKDMLELQHDLRSKDFADSIKTQTDEIKKQESALKDITKGTDEYTAAQEKLNTARNELAETKQARSQYHAQYQQQQQLLSEYAQWQRAQSTENAGDKYNNLFSGLKTAKSDFDKGLIGTDDFKTFAKMISPSGSTDTENFAENYGKAARYITEDESGLVHFFEDLSHKTDEAGNQMAKFNDQTQQWELNVHDLGEVAQKLGTGETVVEALFGRAEDYGATSTVISDQEDGILKTTEAIQNKAEAQARLNQMEEANKQAQSEGKDDIYNTTAIEATRQEVEKYQAQIDGLKESMEYLSEHSITGDQEKQIKTATDEIKSMKQEYDSLMEEANGNTESDAYKTAQQLKDSIQQKANESNLELDAELNVTGVKASAQEGLQKAQESGQISSDINLDYDKSSMSLDQLNSKIQELNNEKVRIQTEADTSGSEETLNQLDTEISALQSQKVQVEIDTALNNGNTVDELLAMSDEKLMTTVGCDASEVETVRSELQSMQGEAINMSVKMDSTQFASLINAITGETVEVPVEVNTDGAVQETTSAIEGSNPKVTPEVDTSNVESQTQSAVQNATQGAKVELPSVDVKGNVMEVTGTPSGTVDVKGKVTSVTGKPSGTVEVKGKLVGNISGTSTKKASVTFSAKHGDVDTYKPKNKNAKVIFGKDSKIPDGYKPDDKSAKVNYTLGSTPSYNPPNIERTVTYTIKTIGSAPSGGSTTHSSSGGKMGGSSGTFASGTMTSLGHARAFASGSLTDFSPAFAKGNVSIPHDQQALVNEVSINGHSESIVRDGVWSMIPGGTHLANLKKGDIIFSASQTEALLKNGSIPGHARAYASGTVDDVGDIDLSHAYAVGGLSLKFSGGLKSHKYGNSGGGSTNTTPTSPSGNSGSGNGGGGGGNNSSTTSKQKHAEQVFDWVARTLTKFKDTVENISNRINDYVSSAFKKTMLNRQEKAIVEEINANKHGAQSYTNKANSIASGYTYYYTPEGSDTEQKMNIVIPDSYKKAVQGGYWNIEDMDTTTDFGKGLAEAIQKYQDYYDKAKDCTQEAQNLYNEQLKVFEQWANMPTEDAGKKIDTLTNKVNGLKSAISSLSTGKSGLASIARQIKVDNPNITKAEQKLNSAKKTQSNAQKKLTSVRKARGNAVKVATQSTIKVDSASSNLRSVLNKSNASSARKTQIRKAINSGQTINTKGLKGTTLKAAQQYNSAVKKNAKDMDRVSRTEYQVTSAQRHLSIANKNVKTQQTNLTNAKKNLTATQRAILSKQKSKKTFVAQNALLDYQTSASKQENAYRQSALKAAQKNMQTYKNNVANRNKSKKALLATKGKITTAQRNAIKKNQKVNTSNIKDPKLKKQLEAYNKYVTASNPDKGRILSNALSTAQSNADQAQAEYAAMRVTNEQEKFKNVQNYYSGWNDRYSNYTEQHQKKYEKSEAHGNYTNSKKYDTQINDLQKQRKYKQNEVTDLQKQLNASVKSGIIKKGSEEWLEMTNQILEAQNAVSDFDTQIEQAKQDKITTVYEEMFDRAIEKANRLKDKIGSINDLITEDMMIDKDTGNLTEMGALSITMNSQQLDTELNNLQTYVKKHQQIMDDFANGSSKSKYGEKTYDELMSENDSAMQESLKNANNYRQSIISIVTNQAKAVQDAMFKEIDARKKALKKKKEYYDYDKTIKKKTDEIELIKQQIRGLEGLTDAESNAQKARLEASLKDKQDDLDDTVRDHVYDITVNGLDDLETQLSEDFEKWSNQLSSDLAKMSDAISNAISGAGENYSDMMAGIDYILNNIGGITSGQYFTSQDKSNMKKSNSLDTGYSSGHLKGYAKGTKHVGGVPRVAMTNENGREIIVTKKGILTPVEPSDGIIPNDMTETLMKMAMDYQNYSIPEIKIPDVQIVNKDNSNGGDNISIHYDTLLTVQGDVTKDALPDLKTILKQASEYTQNDIRKNKRRFG